MRSLTLGTNHVMLHKNTQQLKTVHLASLQTVTMLDLAQLDEGDEGREDEGERQGPQGGQEQAAQDEDVAEEDAEDEDDDEEEELSPEEFAALDRQLDQLNTALDTLEQRNDRLHGELRALLESSREARKGMEAGQGGSGAVDEDRGEDQGGEEPMERG